MLQYIGGILKRFRCIQVIYLEIQNKATKIIEISYFLTEKQISRFLGYLPNYYYFIILIIGKHKA